MKKQSDNRENVLLDSDYNSLIEETEVENTNSEDIEEEIELL